jgi:hypothetical protein
VWRLDEGLGAWFPADQPVRQVFEAPGFYSGLVTPQTLAFLISRDGFKVPRLESIAGQPVDPRVGK